MDFVNSNSFCEDSMGFAEKETLDKNIEVNDRGGLQSKEYYRFDLINPAFLLKIAAVLCGGAEKYGERNYRKIDMTIHLGRAMLHLCKYLAGDREEDHLTHAVCRIMFAGEVN
jgi:hypothetical protein